MNLRFSALLILSFIIAGCGGGGGNSSSTDVTPGNNNTTMGGCFTSFTTVGDPNTTISGKIQYEDKEYGIGGFTGKTTYKAVRFAQVDIVNSGNSNVIDSVFTNSSGIYHIPPTTFTNGTSVYFRVNSYTSGNINGKPDVVVGSTTGTPYGVACDSNFKPQTGTLVTANLYIPTSSPAAGAFNIMDIFTSAGEFIKSLAGTNPTTLKAFWETGNPNGTYYCAGGCPQGDGIYVLSDTGSDTDEYDDDVLWHEYAHFVANKFSKDDSQGGSHFLTSNDLDLRFSWSEGWGDFFPGAVKTWLNSTSPLLLSAASGTPLGQYVDTVGNVAGISFDFGASGGAPYIYSSSEVAVANILLRLRDTFGISAIWNVITSFKTAPLPTPVNLEAFWDKWLLRSTADSEMSTLNSIFSYRAIHYSPDSFEVGGDNSFNLERKLTVGNTEEHTIYGNGDVDYVAFDTMSGKSYTIDTLNLRNGADTVITLYDPFHVPIAPSNDNASSVTYSGSVPNNCDPDYLGGVCHENGEDILGSRLSFAASSTGRYFVGVASSNIRPLSAGRYGTYSLRITPTP